jgi:hypothetical protein
VITAGDEMVDGGKFAEALYGLGYRLIYSTAGPKILYTLLSARVLCRLYLTHAHKTLGGVEFATILDGPLLDPPVEFDLAAAYFDPHALDGLGQLLTVYDYRSPARP